MDAFYYHAGTIACIACIIIGTVGNGLTIYIVARFPNLRNPIGWFILSLAIADFICSTLVIPLNVTLFIYEGKWKFDKALCIMHKFLGFGNSSCSAILIFLIALNRYLKICYSPQVYDRIYTNANIIAMIIFSWIYSHVTFLLFTLDYGAIMLYDDVKEICSLGLSTPIPWIILIGTYLFMVAGLIFSYGKIYKCVAKSRRSVACQSKNMQQQQERVNIKLLKMLGVSTISYLACVLVPLIAGAIGDSDGDFIETAGEMFFIYVPAWIGVILNPIIYGVMNMEYRKAYFKTIPCIES